MNGAALVLHLALLGQEPAPDATYTLSLELAPTLRVAASLTLPAVADEQSAFSVAPEWGGVEHCARFLHDLAFFVDSAPAARAVDHPVETAWVVSHAKGATVQARAVVRSAAGRRRRGARQRLPAARRAEAFLLLGRHGPAHADALGRAAAPHRLRMEGLRGGGLAPRDVVRRRARSRSQPLEASSTRSSWRATCA